MQVGRTGAWLACETRAGVLHAKQAAHWGKSLCAGPRCTSNAAPGLLLSTIGLRPQIYDRHGRLPDAFGGPESRVSMPSKRNMSDSGATVHRAPRALQNRHSMRGFGRSLVFWPATHLRRTSLKIPKPLFSPPS